MAQGNGSLAFIINTASYDRVGFALAAANAGAVLGKKVCVFFGYGGLIRLKKGHVDDVGEETDAWIRDRIKSGVDKGAVGKISDALETLRKLGGTIYACPAAMTLHNLAKEELIDDVAEVCTLTELFRRNSEDANIIYV